MLGRTAGGIFWMFRYLERCENMARLLEAGHRMALTRNTGSDEEWRSVVTTAGLQSGYEGRYDDYAAAHVVNYLLRDKANPTSVLAMLETARHNARMTRTALTREVWEATNIFWMRMKEALARRPCPLSALRSTMCSGRQSCARSLPSMRSDGSMPGTRGPLVWRSS